MAYEVNRTTIITKDGLSIVKVQINRDQPVYQVTDGTKMYGAFAWLGKLDDLRPIVAYGKFNKILADHANA